MSSERFIIYLVAGLLIGFVFGLATKFHKASNACQSINAEYVWGRDFSACVKPDGSLWKVPQT